MTATATGVPGHLATFAKGVIENTSGSLSGEQGERVRKILNDAGTRYWRSEVVSRDGMQARLAELLELDLDDPQQWNTLREIQLAADPAERSRLIRELQHGRGDSTDDATVERLQSAFDQAQLKSLEGLDESYAIETINGDHIELYWNKLASRFEMTVRAEGDRASGSEGFEARLASRLLQRSDPASNATQFQLVEEPAEVKLLNDSDAERLAHSIFGLWRDNFGYTWQIEDRPRGDTRGAGRQSAEQQIDRLRREIDTIKSKKAYLWRHMASGREVRQEHFKRLDETYEYLGPQPAYPNAEAEIERRRQRIAELEQGAPRLPVDEQKPNQRRGGRRAERRSITITVTYPNGHHFVYDKAEFDGRRLTAERTLRSERDITNLPAPVTSQLIASWNPPEWIELEVVADGNDRSPSLEGLWWRMHVTYTPPGGLWGGSSYEIDSIHTPYSRPLTLNDGREQRAMGASREQLP